MSIGCFGWTVSDGFRCSEQAEVIVVTFTEPKLPGLTWVVQVAKPSALFMFKN